MHSSNKHYPVAIALDGDYGWMALYEGFDLRSISFEKVFWLREPSEELGIQIDLCTIPNSKCAGGDNMLVPSIYKTIKNIDYEFDMDKVKEFLK